MSAEPDTRLWSRPPRNWRRLYTVLALVTALSFAPLFSVWAASEIASALGCTLNEGDAHPCILLGVDIGEALFSMFVMGWFMLMTLPGMVITPLIWLGLLIRALIRRTRPVA